MSDKYIIYFSDNPRVCNWDEEDKAKKYSENIEQFDSLKTANKCAENNNNDIVAWLYYACYHKGKLVFQS